MKQLQKCLLFQLITENVYIRIIGRSISACYSYIKERKKERGITSLCKSIQTLLTSEKRTIYLTPH